MLLDAVKTRKLLFFGGKGGVGKTTLASTTATGLAVTGAKVLVVSTDPAHNLGHLWDTRVKDQPTQLHNHASGGSVHGVEIDPQATADAHFTTVENTIRSMMPEHLHGEVRKYFRTATASPGAHEAAMLERIATIALESAPGQGSAGENSSANHWDTIIFDTAPTGHTLRLLQLPELMTTWADGMLKRQAKTSSFHEAFNALPGADDDGKAGTDKVAERNAKIRQHLNRRKELFTRFHALLTDRKHTGFVMVTLPERMPVLETLELNDQLRKAKIPVAATVVNRKTPEEAGGYMAERARLERTYITELRNKLGKRIPVVELGLQPAEITGAEALEALAAQLGD